MSAKKARKPKTQWPRLRPGAPGRWTVVVDGAHPPRLNTFADRNWNVRRRKKNDWGWAVLFACLRAGVTAAAGRRRVAIEVILGYRQRGGDPDAYFKATHDALARCGALVDDSRHWLELVPVAYAKAADRKPATRITIEDLA